MQIEIINVQEKLASWITFLNGAQHKAWKQAYRYTPGGVLGALVQQMENCCSRIESGQANFSIERFVREDWMHLEQLVCSQELDEAVRGRFALQFILANPWWQKLHLLFKDAPIDDQTSFALALHYLQRYFAEKKRQFVARQESIDGVS